MHKFHFFLRYFDKQCSHYLNKVFIKAPESGLSLRNSYHKLKQPFDKISTGQIDLSLVLFCETEF